jgi:tetraacyldisaccharide 4'-kinase
MTLETFAQGLWYGPASRTWWLWPLEGLYRAVTALRRAAYSAGVLRSRRIAAPVIVVGNLTVGGTGKTPVAAWLAGQLGRCGLTVGLVLRGYGGTHDGTPLRVLANSDPAIVGDEAVLHARSGIPIVCVAHDRAAAAEAAVSAGANVVISDDGLQHLRLHRDCEVVVVDPALAFGNGHCLPAGPLREPLARLRSVDAVVSVSRTDGHVLPDFASGTPDYVARLRLGHAINLATGERRPLTAFTGAKVRAVAGVGRPEAFFSGLRAAGLDIDGRTLPDHASRAQIERALAGAETALMTAKDAVKCAAAAGTGWWYVTLELDFAAAEADRLLRTVTQRTGLPQHTGELRG